MKINEQTKGNLLLLITALIWGSAFIFQRKTTEFIDAFTFNTFRALLSTIFFLILYLITKGKKEFIPTEDAFTFKKLILFSTIAGFVLFGAYSFQQFGLKYTTAAKSGFLTSTQVVIVPVLMIFLKNKVKLQSLICTIIALVGFYIMSMNEKFIPSLGDSLTLIGAIFFSVQVLLCGYIGRRVNPFRFGMYFSLFLAIFSSIGMFCFETIIFTNIKNAIIPILYVGIISGVVATTTQILGQKRTNATSAALILSLQSIFALIFGFFFLKEIITMQELIGCLIVFLAVIFAQINFKIKKIEN